ANFVADRRGVGTGLEGDGLLDDLAAEVVGELAGAGGIGDLGQAVLGVILVGDLGAVGGGGFEELEVVGVVGVGRRESPAFWRIRVDPCHPWSFHFSCPAALLELPRLGVGVFGSVAVGVFLAQKRAGGLVVMPGRAGGEVPVMSGVALGGGLKSAQADQLAVVVALVDERLDAVAPHGALLAAGCVGDMLLLA